MLKLRGPSGGTAAAGRCESLRGGAYRRWRKVHGPLHAQLLPPSKLEVEVGDPGVLLGVLWRRHWKHERGATASPCIEAATAVVAAAHRCAWLCKLKLGGGGVVAVRVSCITACTTPAR